MSDSRWQRVRTLIETCLALAPAEREARLERELHDEPDLLAEARELLALDAPLPAEPARRAHLDWLARPEQDQGEPQG